MSDPHLRGPLAAALLLAALGAAPASQAAVAVAAAVAAGDDDLRSIVERQEQLIRRQDERIRALEHKLDSLQAAVSPAAPAVVPGATPRANTAVASTPTERGPEGYPIPNREIPNVIKLRGVLQVDGREFLDHSAAVGQNQFLVRRARPIVEGTVDGFVDFRFTPDFGGGKTTIQDAYISARLAPWAALTAGKFKEPFGLERLALDQDLRFIERSLVSDLAPNRDIGLEVSGELLGGRINYAVAVANGANDGQSAENNPVPDQESNDDKDLAARVFFQPFVKSAGSALRGLGLGAAATWVVDGNASATNPLLPSQYSSIGQQSFFKYRAAVTSGGVVTDTGTVSDGRKFRFSPQAYYYYGPFGVLGEYASVSQNVARTIGTGAAAQVRRATLDHRAWQTAFSWLVTGEDASFSYPKVRTPYTVGGPGWGAFELAARVSSLELDPATFVAGAASFANPATAANKAAAWGLGLNWYLTQHYKVALDYERTRFEGGAAGGGDRPDEQVVLSRFQVAY